MPTRQNVIMAVVMVIGMVTTGMAQEVRTPIPGSITTPDRVESKIGPLQFRDGYPTAETAAKIRDELDYLHGVEAFMNSIQGVSMYALRKGFADVGVKDGDFIIDDKDRFQWTFLFVGDSLRVRPVDRLLTWPAKPATPACTGRQAGVKTRPPPLASG